MAIVVHEAKPHYDAWFKAIIALPLVFLVIGAYSFITTNDAEETITMVGAAVFTGLLYWAIFPKKYQILEDHLKIVLGGPFSFNISFHTIETARVPQGLAVGINFATSFSSKNGVQIVRKKSLDVNITPADRPSFLANMDKALNNWRTYNIRT